MPTTTSKHATKHQCGQDVVDSIFGALGIDNTFLGEPEINAAEEPAPQSGQARPWILHVDDDRDLSTAMGARLETYGVRVVPAYDGTAGVRAALARTASAIILDYEMPNGQGDYVLGRLKDNPITRGIPVIIVTGRRDRFLERRLLSLGAASFFNKPVDFNELLSELGRHIDLP